MPSLRYRWYVSALVFGLALALYLPTLAPGLLWGGGDFALFQVKVSRLIIEPGVFGHPLYVLAAHPFTWLLVGDIAYRVNLASAVFSAAALALLFRLMVELLGAIKPALLGTLALLVSHTFWTYALMPKPYALNSLLLVASLLALVSWRRSRTEGWLFVSGLLLGLGTLSHGLFILFAPAYLMFACLASATARWRSVLRLGAAFSIGLLPTVALSIWDQSAGHGGGIGLEFLYGLLQVMITPRLWATGGLVFVAALGYQFLFSLGAVVVGAVVIWRRDRAAAWLLGLSYLADVAFAWAWLHFTPELGSYIQNFHFYLPSFVIATVWAAYGFDWLLHNRLRSPKLQGLLAALVIAVPIATYLVTPRLVGPILAAFNPRQLPGRDIAVYLFSPWKQNETGPRQLGETILAALPGGATLIAEYNVHSILYYLQSVEGQRPDVQLILLDPLRQEEMFCQRAKRDPLYIPQPDRYYDLEVIRRCYTIVPAGPVMRLIPRSSVSDQHQQTDDPYQSHQGAGVQDAQ